MRKSVILSLIIGSVASTSYCGNLNVSVMCDDAQYRVMTVYQAGSVIATNVQEGAKSVCFATRCKSVKEVIVEKVSGNGFVKVAVSDGSNKVFDTGRISSNCVVRMSDRGGK
jgi:hypothetical protein